MAKFRYKTLNRAGTITKDSGDFNSLAELFDEVEQHGETLIAYSKSSFSLPAFSPRLKRPALAEFFRNLALLIHGGVPLRSAIEDMIAPPCNPLLQKIFRSTCHRIDEGMLFSEALQEKSTAKHLPAIMFPLITIGEETGNLAKTLEDGASHIERIEFIMSSTRRALIYPAFIIFAMSGALVFWMLFVLPQLIDLFKSLGLETLPLPTRILIASTHVFAVWWPILPAIPGAVFLFWWLSKHNEKVRFLWYRFWNRVPLVGNILQSSQLAFFFEYTAMLSAAGIDIIRTMDLMEQSVSNLILKKAVQKIRGEIKSGNMMSSAITTLPFFEPFVLRMVRVGEQTGHVSEQFEILARHYAEKVDKLVNAMSKTLEPMIVIFAGLIFAVIIVGLLGPVYQMISDIS
jgi:type II secretory pathway component PulF